ncbi:MAG: IS1 family transposase, partial [Halothece sp.]
RLGLQPTVCSIHSSISYYQQEKITHAEVGRILGLSSRWEVDAFLKEHRADLHYDETDLERDRIFDSVRLRRNRDRVAAKKLWDSLPPVYRQCATCYTDFWEAYQGILPSKRHKAVGKDSGQTNHIERFNNTLRQRVGRLVRKSLSFSKKFQNHLGAIWDFIHCYNASLQH